MKLLLVFVSMVFIASLLSPAYYAPAGSTIWEWLLKIPGNRYYFLPSVAFAWVLLWCARSGTAILKATASILLCVMSFGVVMDWRNPSIKDLHWKEYARAFEAAPPGMVMIIPENEPGWTIRLVKHVSH